MAYIDPHIHMVSRTTDDYQRMAWAGCVAVTEPAFWAGYDRDTVRGFADYFHQLVDVEPARAAKFSIDHYCWLCINPKEAEDLVLAREVMSLIPPLLARPGVLGIGEIGLNRNTRNELTIFEEHIALAQSTDELILVHTPHLEDKLKGTLLILDALDNAGVDPGRVLIDHVEEHTVGLALERGYWAGMTLYPQSKCTPKRAADMVACYGSERLWVNSAGDWGVSDPLSVPKLQAELRARRHPAADIEQLTLHNPARFLGQSDKFRMPG